MTTYQTLGLLSAAGLAACAALPHSIPTAPATNRVAVPAVDDPSSDPSDGAAEVDATTAGEHEAVSTPAVVSLDEQEAINALFDGGGIPQSEVLRVTAEQMLAVSNSLGVHRSLDPSLCQAAQRYADYLAATNQQGHFADSGPEQRAKRAGFTGTLCSPPRHLSDGSNTYGLGEVLAFGHADLQSAFRGWMASPGHREAVLEPTYDVAGFAFAQGRSGPVWIGMFGNSKVAAAAPPGQVSQPVRSAPQVFSSCGPEGCTPGQQRRAFLPWRR